MSRFKTDKLELNPWVFFPSVGVILVFLLSGVLFTEGTGVVFDALRDFIETYFGWLYILAVGVFLVFVVFLLFSPYGGIRLGPDDSEPDYSYFSWFTMLFSAGMGIGLVFFSVAEPVFHYAGPPTGPGETAEAAQEAMRLTFFHWGFHAWAIYIIVAMALAYFSYRRGLPFSIRSAFYPVLGERIHGPIGNLVDILAIFGTMFGVATSLGIGVSQVNAGLDFTLGIPVSEEVQILLIAGITAVATVSVVLGLDKGIKRLSNLNMSLALLLILFVFLAGPTLFLIYAGVENTGRYLQGLVELTFWADSFGEAEGWQGDWTLFYWAWWIAWSPFVGMFIARISRGRTIREFIGGVLFVPTALTFIWLTIFGNTGLHMELFGDGGLAGLAAEEEMLFAMLAELPWSFLLSAVAMTVIVLFFVTSSDSGSLVIDMLASGGNPDPPTIQRVFWAITEGAVAATLLWLGGLSALQTASITTGLPFTVVLLVMCYSLLKALRGEARDRPAPVKKRVFPARKPESDEPAATADLPQPSGD